MNVIWKFGFRWCEACGCRCMSGACLADDVCGQIKEGYKPQRPEFPEQARAINESLRRGNQ